MALSQTMLQTTILTDTFMIDKGMISLENGLRNYPYKIILNVMILCNIYS